MSLIDTLDTFGKLSLSGDSDDENIQSTSSNNPTTVNILKPKIRKSILAPKMAQFKVEYLNCIPTFDGNPNDLNRYLSICDSIINQFYDATNPESFQNKFLINSLVGKLSGNAKLVANIQNINTWQELKDALHRNFADQRDESCLTRDLVLMKQNPNEKPSQFFDRCLQLLNLLCSYIDSHETTAEAKMLKRSLYNNLTLKTFLAGLKEPLGTTIRSMRPSDMNQALQFIIQEENINYFQNSTRAPSKPNNVFTNPIKSNFQAPAHVNHSFQMQQQNQYRPPNQFPSQPIPVRPRTDLPPPRFPRASQVFPQQKPNPMRNVFKPNPVQRRLLPNPTPMSVCTSQNSNRPYPQQQNFTHSYFRPTGPPNFTFEELYNTESDESNPYASNYEENIDYCEFPENFVSESLQQYNETSTSHECQCSESNERQNFQETPQIDKQK